MNLPTSPKRIYRAAPEAEIVRGEQDYRETLRCIHERFAPEVYLEIGVRHGYSLALANSRVAIGIDPMPELRAQMADNVRVVSATSDEFFAKQSADVLNDPVDLAFIDGMHHFEFALRDFMNVERHTTPASVIIFDDVFPNHPLQARRERQSGVWTGDVWKIVPCLREYRPDLDLLLLDTNPTGLLVVTNLQSANRVLSESYAAIVEKWVAERGPPSETFVRHNAVSPHGPALFDLLQAQRLKRSTSAS